MCDKSISHRQQLHRYVAQALPFKHNFSGKSKGTFVKALISAKKLYCVSVRGESIDILSQLEYDTK